MDGGRATPDAPQPGEATPGRHPFLTSQLPQVLVGNKSDMDESKRAVPYSRGQALADEFRMQARMGAVGGRAPSGVGGMRAARRHSS